MSRKEKMKVYHGIPKSVTDEHTIFYASFDGTVIPEIGNEPTVTTPSFTPNATGLGVSTNLCIPTLRLDNKYVYTCDLWVDTSVISSLKGTTNQLYIMRGREKSDTNNSFLLYYVGTNNIIYITCDKKSGSYAQTYATMPLDSKFTHFRVVSTISGLKVYINGIIVMSIDIPYTDRYDFDMLYNSMSGQRYTTNKICDLHISDIDRGDYFPNLPQDFIEGKAIIKERLGQQQIKGDPLYSQVTTVTIPAYVGSNTNLYYINSDGTGNLLTNPEVINVNHASEWSSGASFKIKGLNGEIISGVIDSDTALCRVVEYARFLINTYFDIKVSDTSKLAVGDTLRILYNKGNIFTVPDDILHVRAIKDSTTVTLECTNTSGTIDANTYETYLIESTASSSSPVVKSEDGTTVVGTWSGLGTNEATFTLGTNTDLFGKDLYVTYSLNIPNGNSDFPELPYSVDRAYNEVGLEMNPVTEIVIEDDFRGKVMGDLVNCPHISKFHNYTTLVNPTDNWAGELPTSNYNLMQSLDGTTNPVLNTLNNHIPQQLFSFNLIEMVERKLGCEIPSRDKVQWLIDNIIELTAYYCGYGISPQGNSVTMNMHFEGQDWSYYPSTHKQSYAYGITRTITSSISKIIKSDGFVYVIAYTNASDGVTQSAIYTDYVNLEIKLKTDSTFTTLYCDNKRAREDSCNPVLVQKETKTVKRYLPSKECFITECLYLPYRKNASLNNGIIMAIQKEKVVSTCGTGSYVANDEQGAIKDYLHILPPLSDGSQPYDYSNEVIWIKGDVKDSNHSHTLRVPIVRYWGGKLYNSIGATNTLIDSCATLPLANEVLSYPRYEFYGVLKNVKGELFLTIQIGKVKPLGKGLPWTNNQSVLDYRIPNRPLIK